MADGDVFVTAGTPLHPMYLSKRQVGSCLKTFCLPEGLCMMAKGKMLVEMPQVVCLKAFSCTQAGVSGRC